MDLDLKSRVIIVTGGANGIGAAIVHACGQEGAVPVIFDRDEPAARKLRQQLSGKGIESEVQILDLSDSAACFAAVENVTRKCGRLDGLVNNAGLNDGVGLEHGSPKAFAASFSSNFGHYCSMMQATVPFLIESKGAIVNVSSKVAVTGQGGTSGYAAAKGAILDVTAEWAADLAQHGIRVNAVIPAEVRTPQYERWIAKFDDAEERLRNIQSNIPLEGRLTEPEEVAALVLFLLSSKSSCITGQQLFVDGGYAHMDRALTSLPARHDISSD